MIEFSKEDFDILMLIIAIVGLIVYFVMMFLDRHDIKDKE